MLLIIYLDRSMDWYETTVVGQSFCDSGSQDESMFETQPDLVCSESIMGIQENSQSKEDFLSPMASHPSYTKTNAKVAQSPEDLELDQHSALGSLGLTSSLNHDGRDGSAELGNVFSEQVFVSGAADNLIHSMTKMMNPRRQRSSQLTDEGIDVEPETAPLSQPQRHMLRKVLSTALERLSDDTQSIDDTDTGKLGWFQCDSCPKRTRLRCEMK